MLVTTALLVTALYYAFRFDWERSENVRLQALLRELKHKQR